MKPAHPTDNRSISISCISAVILLCTALTAESIAVSDRSDHPVSGQQAAQQIAPGGLRTPPKAAVAACDGKNEGDACTFGGNDGDSMTGECLSGRENIFACRPHRRESQTVPRREPANESQPDAQRNTKTAPGTPEKNKPAPASETKPASVKPTEAIPVVTLQPQPPLEHPPTAAPESAAKMVAIGSELWCDGIVWGLAGMLIGAVLTWYGFFRYSTVPLRRLRMVTQQLAGGNLSARVGEGLVLRKDEVADLARDVDRMAERIESLVGSHQRLIRDVSHELRSPLARLNVALELARQSAGPNHSAPFDRIERESNRLNELIGQLLMLTRLENESAMGIKIDVDLAGLIGEVAHDADFEARGKERGVTVSIMEPLMVSGNRELLRQALENLVRNAVCYTEIGTMVEISLKMRATGGRKWAHIEVLDHGPGIPESELFNIFRPFYRVDDSRERQSGGTGVGLAISDRAVRLHGGSLRAFNVAGGGLVMEMELPLT